MENLARNESLDETQSLARLKFIVDGVLKKAPDNPTIKRGDIGYLSASLREGMYDLTFGMRRRFNLRFTQDLVVLEAEIHWEEGNPDHYADEFEPVADWRRKKWFEDFQRQRAEGQTILRFGDENFAQLTKIIDKDHRPGFVAAILRAVETELVHPDDWTDIDE